LLKRLRNNDENGGRRHEIKNKLICRSYLQTRLEIKMYKHVIACLAIELLEVNGLTFKDSAAKRNPENSNL